MISQEGKTFEYTFETAGTYDYFCIPHKGLETIGQIVVSEPSGPAEGDMPPDGRVLKSARIVEQIAVMHDEFTE